MVTVSDPSTSSHTGLPGLPGEANGAPALLRDLTRGAHQTINHLAEQATPPVQRLQARVDGAAEVADSWMAALRCTVRRRPLAALGAALAFGMLVGRLAR